jgi:hypothetical protein
VRALGIRRGTGESEAGGSKWRSWGEAQTDRGRNQGLAGLKLVWVPLSLYNTRSTVYTVLHFGRKEYSHYRFGNALRLKYLGDTRLFPGTIDVRSHAEGFRM